MGVFHFKEFDVCDDHSGMKVGTDGVLLGAATEVDGHIHKVLDIGTGTGLVALMLAQKISKTYSQTFEIQGIDIDSAAAVEASMNFARSPWKEHLQSMNMSLRVFETAFPDASFDLVISNPPYYDSSLEAPDPQRNTARHTGNSLSYRDVLEYASRHLSEMGRVSMILPADQEAGFLRYAGMLGLRAFKILRIRTVAKKRPSRIIVMLTKKRNESVESELVLLDSQGQRTPQHAALTKDFYL